MIENPDLALKMIGRFVEAGIKISIDDFGTGLSSLAYLKQIRGQELKIDKSLVEGVTESQPHGRRATGFTAVDALQNAGLGIPKKTLNAG